ncbi:MAG: alpha/beta fold hydrolase [Gammaproteobacteria bacterium]|nr:alpha/beta fold hydrolase [Gammaproteobacteria bacterium]
MSDAITPFKVDIPQAELDELKARLANVRWPEKEAVEDWSQGVPLAYAQELAAYWRDEYDWRRWETRMNSWEQFTTEIDGIDIHFLHVKSPHAEALPLVMTHGWPGSIVEFHKIIDPLVNPTEYGGKAEDAFHLVCPSLPGYGFSGKPTTSGTSVDKIGVMWGQLMARLGYDRYVAQGGDWGSIVTQAIGQTQTEHCAGIHITMPIALPDEEGMQDMTEWEQAALESMGNYDKHDSGYSKQQGTRPQTLGYGLADSPVGQMAWIVEKFWSWMDCGEGEQQHPENVLSKDELLDNVMMYWLTNSAASSGRLYWESFSKVNMDPIHMPVGCSIFPKELFRASQRWAAKRFTNIIYWNDMDSGGHFAAFEKPEVFVGEVRNCFRTLR